MAAVQTARGAIDLAEVGFTLMHEHLSLRDYNVRHNYPQLFDEESTVRAIAKDLEKLKAKGVDTIVDLTTVDLGRDIGLIGAVAGVVEVNILVASGIHIRPPAFFASRPIELLRDAIVSDIETGIAGTALRAAVIKLATDREGITPAIEHALRAGARAHRLTGVPIYTHTHAPLKGGIEQQTLFAEEGVDLTRVVIGHSGDTTDAGYLKELMERGSFIGMDRFGLEVLGAEPSATPEERLDTVVDLCRAGYAERMVLSHDSVCEWDAVPADSAWRQRNPRWSFFHILDDVLPALRGRGLGEEAIRTMMVDNPRRIFGVQGGY